jgi:hypothetical protein
MSARGFSATKFSFETLNRLETIDGFVNERAPIMNEIPTETEASKRARYYGPEPVEIEDLQEAVDDPEAFDPLEADEEVLSTSAEREYDVGEQVLRIFQEDASVLLEARSKVSVSVVDKTVEGVDEQSARSVTYMLPPSRRQPKDTFNQIKGYDLRHPAPQSEAAKINLIKKVVAESAELIQAIPQDKDEDE